MRPRIVMLLAFVIAAVAVGFTGARFTYLPATPPAVHASLPPAPTSYLGVFENGAPPSYGPIEDFTKAAGKEPNLIGYYSGWAEPFATSFAESMHGHGVIPFVQIDPTLASVAGIADGTYDGYLKLYADSVRDFGHPVVIGFGHEMNAPWYSWGYGNVLPSTFVAAWKHIVDLFRSEGADNVTWLWTIQADEKGTGPIASWWPGLKYVTWVGIDGYYSTPSDTFANIFAPTIEQVRTFTSKPILLSETAVGRHDNQLVNIVNLFNGMAQYKTLGLVWFDKDKLHQSTPAGTPDQDWRIEDNAQAEQAFQAGVSGLRLVSTEPAKTGGPRRASTALPAPRNPAPGDELGLSGTHGHDQL
jgi:glycosyl hydrolase family 26